MMALSFSFARYIGIEEFQDVLMGQKGDSLELYDRYMLISAVLDPKL